MRVPQSVRDHLTNHDASQLHVLLLSLVLPPLVAVFPLDAESGTKDITNNNQPGIPSNVRPAPGPDGRQKRLDSFHGINK